jgi:hypothetical protein|tara:strand:+ start:7801 stop:8829 length:1029 start_codon:yes stop_codon:yes gene_type:complete
MTSRAYELSQTVDIDGDQVITGNTIFNTTGYMTVPVGTTAQRPAGVYGPNTGQVRYNSTLGKYEGYHDAEWIALNDLIDKDQDTKITVHEGWGNDEDEIKIYAGDAGAGNEKILVNTSQIIATTDDYIGLTASHLQLAAAHTVITGNLTVQGTQTKVESTTLVTTDKTIELSNAAIKTTATATGAGIQVNDGATDRSILWNNSGTKWEITDNVSFGGDVIMGGNTITFGNGETIDNTVDGTVQVSADKLKLTGNVLQNSQAEDTITMNAAQEVIIDSGLLGGLGRDIAITMGHGNTVTLSNTVTISGGSPAQYKLLQDSDGNGLAQWISFGVYNTSGTRLGP